MRIAGLAVLCVAVGLALPGVSSAQALIEYGHVAARAGAAGAGAGTGLAGILTKLRSTTEKSAQGTSSKGTTRQRPEFAADDLANRETTDNAPRKLTTSTGIVVSGIPSTPLGGGYVQRAPGPVEVQQVSWSSPGEVAAGSGDDTVGASDTAEELAENSEAVAAAEAPPAAESSGDDSASETEGPAMAPQRQFKPIYAESKSEGADALLGVNEPESAQPQPVVAAAESIGISIGDDIEQVLAKLGKPSFAFKGINGEGYTEKYVFKTADGGRLVVLTWHGKVSSVILG